MSKNEFDVHEVDLTKGTAKVSLACGQTTGSTITFSAGGKTIAQFKGSGKIKQKFALKNIPKESQHITAAVCGSSGDVLTTAKASLKGAVMYGCGGGSCAPKKQCEKPKRCNKCLCLIGAWDRTFPFVIQDQGDSETNIPNGPSATLTRLVLDAAGWTEGLDYRIVESRYQDYINFDDDAPAFHATSDHICVQQSWTPVKRRLGHWDYGLPAAPTPVQGELRVLSLDPENASCPDPQDAVIAYVGAYSLSPSDLEGTPYENATFVSVDAGNSTTLTEAINDSGANLVYGFVGSPYASELEGEVCFTVDAVTDFFYAPLVNKGHPCHDAFIVAWYVGLRRIVQNGSYQQYIDATSDVVSGVIGTPWTKQNFPDLIHPEFGNDQEMALAQLLQNRVIYKSLECGPC